MGTEGLLDRLESATVEELAEIIRGADADDERALRDHLGNDRFRRLRGLALRQKSVRRENKRGNVVVVPAFFGSALTATARDGGRRERLWLSLPRIIDGSFVRLQLDDSGQVDRDPGWYVAASGILKRPYAELLLTLALDWETRAFYYDWRKDIRLAASSLESSLSEWFGADEPVHLVAHGHGGLVARAFIKSYQRRWEQMAHAPDNQGFRRGGRLITLGTAHHGSFFVARELFAGSEGLEYFKTMAGQRSGSDLIQTYRSFVGLYQMLPSPLAVPEAEVIYDDDAPQELNVPRSTLRLARNTYTSIVEGAFDDRMVHVAGYGYSTITRLKQPYVPNKAESYDDPTYEGDGVVPLRLGVPGNPAVRTYFIEEEHGELVSNPRILNELGKLLEAGETHALERKARAVHSAARAPGPASTTRSLVGPVREVRQLEEVVTRNLLGGSGEQRRSAPPRSRFKTPTIEIGLYCRSIAEEFDELDGLPVDALSIALYLGEKPQGAARDLDRAISLAMARETGDRDGLPDSELLLSQFVERGIIRGELGHPFLINDPRPARGGSSATPNRVIAVTGMGLPGRFGIPELTVLVRELAWALGRLGKHHLATASVGTRNQVLYPADAVSAWIRGLKHALTGTVEEDFHHLRCISFLIDDPRKIRPLDEALKREEKRSKQLRDAVDGPRFEFTYKNPWDPARLDGLTAAIREATRREIEALERSKDSRDGSGVPTRVTLSLDRRTYRFGAVTATASVPEREIPLDPELVRTANDELAAESEPAMQLERGQFLERLLVPADLRPAMASDSPLVMLLDATTARIHWEMIATSEALGPAVSPREGAETSSGLDPKELFLGTSRGFTRQLRTTFAPPPEPPPPPRRIIRVLVVADPARDARLPGAELEGFEVAELFEQFNQVYEHTMNRVQVVRLFGPSEATRTNLLRRLMLRSFDLLHFAGHCVYDTADPPASGWVFSNGERISANELKRIDRVPKFIFSNACESGVTPERPEMRTPDLAPSFAESFFARGVSNFVCTAWPVDDTAARQFALELYMGLLGLERDVEGPGPRRYRRAKEPGLIMHRSMRNARLAIIDTPGGVRTWGAYQHYGNPDFRLFEAESLGYRPRVPEEPAASTVSAPAAASTDGAPAAPRKHARRPPAPPKA